VKQKKTKESRLYYSRRRVGRRRGRLPSSARQSLRALVIQSSAPAPGAPSPWDSALGAIEDSISQCTFLQMTYTAEKPARRWQRRARSTPTLPPAPPPRPPQHVPRTHDNRMAGRQMSCRQQTAPPQSRCSKDVTAHPHRPGARPGRPCPVPACSGQPLPGKRRFSSPLRNRIFPPLPSRSIRGQHSHTLHHGVQIFDWLHTNLRQRLKKDNGYINDFFSGTSAEQTPPRMMRALGRGL
jgi:hypothetical protein